MKKHFIPGLMVCCIAAVICSQSVFAQETELEVPDVTVNSEECYEEPVDIQPGKIVELPTGEDLYKEGFVFVGWNTDPNATEGFFVYEMPNEDVTLYAVWVPADPIPESPSVETPAADSEEAIETPDAPEAPDVSETTETTGPNETEEPETTEPPVTSPDGETSETDPSQTEQPDAEAPSQDDEAEDSQDAAPEGQEEPESSAEETEDTAIQDSTEGNAEAAEEIAEETTTVEPTEPAPAA